MASGLQISIPRNTGRMLPPPQIPHAARRASAVSEYADGCFHAPQDQWIERSTTDPALWSSVPSSASASASASTSGASATRAIPSSGSASTSGSAIPRSANRSSIGSAEYRQYIAFDEDSPHRTRHHERQRSSADLAHDTAAGTLASIARNNSDRSANYKSGYTTQPFTAPSRTSPEVSYGLLRHRASTTASFVRPDQLHSDYFFDTDYMHISGESSHRVGQAPPTYHPVVQTQYTSSGPVDQAPPASSRPVIQALSNENTLPPLRLGLNLTPRQHPYSVLENTTRPFQASTETTTGHEQSSCETTMNPSTAATERRRRNLRVHTEMTCRAPTSDVVQAARILSEPSSPEVSPATPSGQCVPSSSGVASSSTAEGNYNDVRRSTAARTSTAERNSTVKPARTSPTVRSSTAARSGSPELDWKCWIAPDCPDCEHPRKVLSHFFGRNKTETKRMPKSAWLRVCRKHYQRKRYRGSRAKCFHDFQMLMMEHQLASFVQHMGTIRWTIQYAQSLGKNLTTYMNKLADNPGSRPEASPEVLAAYELRGLCGRDKSTEQVKEYLEMLSHYCKANRMYHIIAVEFLAATWGPYAR